MMKTTIFIYILFISTRLFAQDTIYTIAYTFPQPVSYFEDRDTAGYFYKDNTQANNLWQIGTPIKNNFDSSFSIPLALVTDSVNSYLNENTSSFEFVVYSDDATYLSFWHRFDTDTLNDGGIIEVSVDGGISWLNIIDATQFSLLNFYSSNNLISSYNNQPGFSGNSGGWINSSIYGYALNYTRFRFNFTSDNINSNKDGWILDNFEFICFGTGVADHLNRMDLVIFPNPTSELINLSNYDLDFVIIKDLTGKIILRIFENIVDISKLNSGMYILEGFNKKNIYSTKFIKN